MSKSQQRQLLADAIYEATQKGKTVGFSKDFPCMTCVLIDGKHRHCGTPHDPDSWIIEAANFINHEIQDNG